MFLVSWLDVFRQIGAQPYTLNIVEPDEHALIDKKGPGGAVVANFQGAPISIVQDDKDDTDEIVQDKLKEAR